MANDLSRAQRRARNQQRQRERNAKKQQAQAATPPPATAELANGTVSQPPAQAVQRTAADNRSTGHASQEISKAWRMFFSWAEVALAAAIFGATVAQVVVGDWQWDAMERQNAEMIEQRKEMAKQTDALIETNKISNSQLAAAKGQLSEMVEQSKGAAEQSRLAQRQLEIAQGQLELGRKASADTLAQMRLEQRPWIKTSSVKFEKLEVDNHVSAEVQFTNTGRNPAFIYSFRGAAIISGTPTDDDTTAINTALSEFMDMVGFVVDATPYEVVAPGDTTTIHIMAEEHLTQKQFDDIGAGFQEAYIVGRVYYSDVSGLPFYTDYCVFADGRGGYLQYQNYNQMK